MDYIRDLYKSFNPKSYGFTIDRGRTRWSADFDSGMFLEMFLRSSSHYKPKPSQSAIVQQFRRDFTPPDGWTNDPKEMFAQETFEDPEGEGYELLQSLGLRTVTPVMAHTRQNGGTLYLFESGGNFYIWNIIEGTARRFQDKDFDKILQSMLENRGGTKKLQFERSLFP